jgi:hypothetical protein
MAEVLPHSQTAAARTSWSSAIADMTTTAGNVRNPTSF